MRPALSAYLGCMALVALFGGFLVWGAFIVVFLWQGEWAHAAGVTVGGFLVGAAVSSVVDLAISSPVRKPKGES